MQDAGYQYVNLDDCWMNGRDASGKLRWNTTKFPSGIAGARRLRPRQGAEVRHLRDAQHRDLRGLLYNRLTTLGGRGQPRPRDHGRADVRVLGRRLSQVRRVPAPLSGFAVMRDALRATGRPIFYSINPGNGTGDLPAEQLLDSNLCQIANMWRIGFDINSTWAIDHGLIDQDATLSSYAGPGHWNDPDMLEVGNGLTDTEGRAHFSMWAILAAPLIAGNDLRSMSASDEGDAHEHRGHRRRPGSAGRARAARGVAGDEPAGVVEDAVGDEHPRGRAVQSRHGGPRRSPCSGARSASRPAPRPSATSGATPISAASAAPTRRRRFPATAS